MEGTSGSQGVTADSSGSGSPDRGSGSAALGVGETVENDSAGEVAEAAADSPRSGEGPTDKVSTIHIKTCGRSEAAVRTPGQGGAAGGGSGGSRSSKSINSTSSGKKKKKEKKAVESSPSSAVYGIERSLLTYRGNDALLSNYLASLNPCVVFPPQKSSVLEADVVVDLLLGVSRCLGDLQGDWDGVYAWFSAARSISSFDFIRSLLSEQQVSALRQALERCTTAVGDTSGLMVAYHV